jgi:hypothetical protein
VQKRGFLDFDDFKRFVKLLKARPEVERLYKKLCSFDDGRFSYRTFEHFMRVHQKVSEPMGYLFIARLTLGSSQTPMWTICNASFSAMPHPTPIVVCQKPSSSRSTCLSMTGLKRLKRLRLCQTPKALLPRQSLSKASPRSYVLQITLLSQTRMDQFTMT